MKALIAIGSLLCGTGPTRARAARMRFPILKMLALSGAGLVALGLPSLAAAQSGEKVDTVREDAVDAVAQPLEDLNLRNKDIPTILIIAQAAPYELAAVTRQKDTNDCQLIGNEIVLLEEMLGPDVDQEPEKESLANKGLQLGGSLLGGLIPFRGVIRQLTGANAEREKMERAIYAGIARRSFLKGYAQGIGCAPAEETAEETAEISAE